MAYVPRLKKKFREEVLPQLKKELGYTSVMQVPRLRKICINQGVGAGVADKKAIETAVHEMSLIAGQKAVATLARKSISNFKLREDMPIGARVTLRGDMMYEFLDRLISVTLPRVRDFRGLAESSFDGRGNYTLGIKEQIVFTEIDIDNVTKISGMDITIVTSAKSDREAYLLLSGLGLPFKKDKN